VLGQLPIYTGYKDILTTTISEQPTGSHGLNCMYVQKAEE